MGLNKRPRIMPPRTHQAFTGLKPRCAAPARPGSARALRLKDTPQSAPSVYVLRPTHAHARAYIERDRPTGGAHPAEEPALCSPERAWPGSSLLAAASTEGARARPRGSDASHPEAGIHPIRSRFLIAGWE